MLQTRKKVRAVAGLLTKSHRRLAQGSAMATTVKIKPQSAKPQPKTSA